MRYVLINDEKCDNDLIQMVIDNNSSIIRYHSENFDINNFSLNKLYQSCQVYNRMINLSIKVILSKNITITTYIYKCIEWVY